MNATPMRADGSGWLWEPVGLLPSQLAKRNACLQSAEVRLAAAMFEDALRSLTRNINPPAGPRWKELVDACEWIWDERRDWPFAFVNVCDLLGLDAAAVRCRLESLVARRARRGERIIPGTGATVVPLRARHASR